MKKKFILLVLSLSFSMLFAAKTITLVSDPWMPYSGDGKSSNGLIADIAKTVFQDKGYDVVYSVVPWSRAIKEVQAGKYDGLVGIYKEDASGFIIPKEKVGISLNKFYTRKGFNWKYNGADSVKNIRIGVIQDYSYAELDPYIKKNKETKKVTVMKGANPLLTLLKQLVNNRIDVIVDDQQVVAYTASQAGLFDKMQEAGVLGESHDVVLVFTPKRKKQSNKYAKILSKGIKRLRKNGELDKILANYGLTDWEK